MTSKSTLYPLKFTPILKDKIWGGQKLKQQLHKSSTSDEIGESWELSGVPGNISEVANGDLQGQNLQQLIKTYKHELVGNKVYNQFKDQFPLLIKFIDAADTLSVQLHPDDELAKQRHNSFGKTEMWYIVDHDDGGSIIADFKEKITKDQLHQYIQKGNLADHLKVYPTKKGDTFFISPGLVHAIGKGVLLAEIQQTSDITYRLFDWNRKDSQGNERELHIDESVDAIDYSLKAEPKVQYDKKQKDTLLVDNKYFTTSRLKIDQPKSLDFNDRDSFTILMNVDGEVDVTFNNQNYKLAKGETMLIPAKIKQLKVSPQADATLLDVHVN